MRSSRRLLILLALSGAALASPAAAGVPAQTRIIGGSPASDTQFPYQARLVIRRGSSSYLCGAAIRDATHVMTAAHCVVDSGSVSAPSDVTVYYGAASRSQQRAVATFEVRPAQQYVAGDDSWDAALITLASPLVGYGSSTVDAIPLATAAETASAVSSGAQATVSGFGLTEQGTLPSTLRGTQVTLRPDSRCTSTYGSATFVSSRFVCAGGTGTAQSGNPDSCSGDSGGPLVTSTASGVRLIGLVSFGPNSGCGQPNVPAAYTEVSNPSIAALLTGTTAEAPAGSGSTPNLGSIAAAPGLAGQGSTAAVPVPARPVAQPAAATPARVTARLTSVRCVRRRCTIRVKGTGSALTARISKRVRTCTTRGCRLTYKRVATRAARRAGNGYTIVVRLRPGSYRVDAVAANSSGARSAPATRRFRVRG